MSRNCENSNSMLWSPQNNHFMLNSNSNKISHCGIPRYFLKVQLNIFSTTDSILSHPGLVYVQLQINILLARFSYADLPYMYLNCTENRIYLLLRFSCRIPFDPIICTTAWMLKHGKTYSNALSMYRGFSPYATFGTWKKVALAKNRISKIFILCTQ